MRHGCRRPGFGSQDPARPLSLDDLRGELKIATGSEDQKRAALKEYADGLAYIQQHDFAQAIQALEKSIASIPTLAAQTTLAYLYKKQGDPENAKKYAAAAQSLASQRGDSVAQVRLEKLSTSDGNDGTGVTGLVGDKVPLPEGGKSYAAAISPGLYITKHDLAAGVYPQAPPSTTQTAYSNSPASRMAPVDWEPRNGSRPLKGSSISALATAASGQTAQIPFIASRLNRWKVGCIPQ